MCDIIVDAMLKSPILALHYPGCTPTEVLPAIRLLKCRYPIVSASPDGLPCPAFAEAGVTECFKFENVLDGNFVAVLVPGGDPGSLLGNHSIEEILRNSSQKGAILSAVCAGPFLLAKAGLLENKKISHGYSPEQISWLRSQGYFLNCQMSGDILTIDGNIFTATPKGAEDLAKALDDALATA